MLSKALWKGSGVGSGEGQSLRELRGYGMRARRGAGCLVVTKEKRGKGYDGIAPLRPE